MTTSSSSWMSVVFTVGVSFHIDAPVFVELLLVVQAKSNYRLLIAEVLVVTVSGVTVSLLAPGYVV